MSQSGTIHRDLLIGGRSEVGEEGVRTILNPFSGTPAGSVSYASWPQMERAISAAKGAFEHTRTTPAYERSALLERCSKKILERKDELARTIVSESGKPISYACAEVDRASSTFKAAAEVALRAAEGVVMDSSVAPNGVGRRISYRYFPIGVIAAITPFNFPLNLVAHKVAPAIAAGNTIVLKPAPQTPLTPFLLADILTESGIADGVLNVVPCENGVAEQLVKHEDIRMLSFTGSAPVGWKLKSIAGKAKVTLELGGNGMTIVDEVQNWDALIASIITAAFNYAGQVCIKLQNLLVNRGLYEEMLERLIAAATKACVGDPLDEKTLVGPMISEAAAKKVEGWINDAVGRSATRHTGEYRAPNWITPTIMTEVPTDSPLWCEEAFAPVLMIKRYDNFEDAISLVNASKYGLQTAIFTNDARKIKFSYEKLEVGGVIVNDTNNFRLDTMPYGGVKASGFGREGVEFAMREMSELKLLVEKFG